MWFRTAALVTVVIVASITIGTAAFTTGQVDRSASVNVVADENALIGLQPGDSSLVYSDGTTGELTIDFGNLANADGINPGSTYTIGDDTNANETFAFNVTNNHDSAKDYTFGYTFDTDPGGSAAVNVTIYNDTSELGQATNSADASVNVAAGDTVYVHLTFDAAGVDQTGDLSGTLSISA